MGMLRLDAPYRKVMAKNQKPKAVDCNACYRWNVLVKLTCSNGPNRYQWQTG